MIIGQMNVDREIERSKQMLHDMIFGVSYFTVVYKIDGRLSHEDAAHKIIKEDDSNGRNICAWSMDDEIRRFGDMQDDLIAAEEAMSADYDIQPFDKWLQSQITKNEEAAAAKEVFSPAIEECWPECFITGEVNLLNTTEGRAEAVALGLTGWGNCHAGHKPPENFGIAMAELSRIAEVLGTSESFMEASEKVLEELNR